MANKISINGNAIEVFASAQLNGKTDIIYLNDHEISLGPKTRKTITYDNDVQLTDYINGLEFGAFKSALTAFQHSEKYQTALTNGKTAPMDFGDSKLVKVSKITVDWKNEKDLADFYARRSEAVKLVRSNHGFGQLLESYSPTDWRFKYKGVGIEPEKSIKPALYKSVGSSLYQKEDGTLAVRQFPEASVVPFWIYADGGKCEIVPADVCNFLATAYSASKPKSPVTLNEEEQSYVDELNNIADYNKQELTFVLDNVASISSTDTVIDNSSSIVATYPYLSSVVANILNA